MLLKLADHFKIYNNLSIPQRGIVKYNKDERGLGRIKCVVAGILDDTSDRLPWIYPWTPTGKGGTSGQASLDIPPIGSTVMVEFRGGDVYSGFYTGTVESTSTQSGQFGEDYPHTSGSRDEFGNVFIKNKKKGTIEYSHPSGTTIQVFKNGDVNISTTGKITHESENRSVKSVLDSKNRSNTLQGETVNVEGSQANIKSQNLSVTSEIINEEVTGPKISNIQGGKQTNIGGSSTKTTLGNSATVVGGATDDLYGQKVTRSYGLGLEERILTGGITQRILAGGIDLTLVLGGVTHTLTAGNYNVDVVAGNISITTKVGSVEYGNALGKIEIDPTGNVTVGNTLSKAKFEVSGNTEIGNAVGKILVDPAGGIIINAVPSCAIKGAQVAIGNAPLGFVLTTVSDPVTDLITGAPAIGVSTITAG